jgi:hypothetical protein
MDSIFRFMLITFVLLIIFSLIGIYFFSFVEFKSAFFIRSLENLGTFKLYCMLQSLLGQENGIFVFLLVLKIRSLP